MKHISILINILINVIYILGAIVIFQIFMGKIVSICEKNGGNIKSYGRYYKCEYKSLENRK